MSGAFKAKYMEICGGSRMLAWLISVNIGVSVAAWIAIAVIGLCGGNSDIVADILALPSALPVFVTRPWTLFTYMVTQFSVLHLIVNILWLFWFGRLVLAEISDRQLGLCYLAGGLAGGAGYLITSASGGEAGAYLCGSSAAVLAVMCMAGILMGNCELRFMLIGNVKVKWVTVICVVLTLIGTKGVTAVTVAHLGGIAGGICFALALKSGLAKRGVSFSICKLRRQVQRSVPRSEKDLKTENVAEAMRGRLNDHQRLDQLLDKIRLSGYNSLSEIERRELEALTKRL